jgi:hypothetical protein
MKFTRSALFVLSISVFCGVSFAFPDWLTFLNKVASNVALTIYDAPELIPVAEGIQLALGIIGGFLTVLGIEGPTVENRGPGQCARKTLTFMVA